MDPVNKNFNNSDPTSTSIPDESATTKPAASILPTPIDKNIFFSGSPPRFSATLLAPLQGNITHSVHTLFGRTSPERPDALSSSLPPIEESEPAPPAPPVVIKRSRTHDEEKSDFASLFRTKIIPYYLDRLKKTDEACRSFLLEIDYIEGREANAYGQIMITALANLLQIFSREINYSSFNPSLKLKLNDEEIEQLLNECLNTPELLKQREDLSTHRKECVDTTQAFLEIMTIKPNEQICITIQESLQRLTDHKI